MTRISARTSLIAGAAAAVGASLCCVGPLVLLTLGVGGTWIANLTALEPYRPLFVSLTLLFLALAAAFISSPKFVSPVPPALILISPSASD